MVRADNGAFLLRDLRVFYGACKMIELLILAAAVMIIVIIREIKTTGKEVAENEKIANDFAESLRTGNDYPWRGEK